MNAAWAPLIITLMALIVIMLCCCFLRIDPSARHSYEVEIERRIKEAEMAEAGFDDIELRDESEAGIDNVAFREENEDAVSRYTTSTVEADNLDKEDENGNKSNNKKRPKIRTNPHMIIKEGNLEKKVKKKKAEEKSTTENQEYPDDKNPFTDDEEDKQKPEEENTQAILDQDEDVEEDKTEEAPEEADKNNDVSEYGKESLEIQGIQGCMNNNDTSLSSNDANTLPPDEPVGGTCTTTSPNAAATRPKLERVDTDETTSIDTNIPTDDELIINPRKMMQSQISTLSSSCTGEQRFIA